MEEKTEQLVKEAKKVYEQQFGDGAWFERALFYSWACQQEHCCTYCYMSTLPKEKRTNERVRSFSSLLAETLLCRECGWIFGFLAGGVNVFSDEKVYDLLEKINAILGYKVWINIGNLNAEQMRTFKPFIRGVIGTIEVMDDELHGKVCPSKPKSAVESMFQDARHEGLERGMTLIVGLGEPEEDIEKASAFIERHGVTKVHLYGLNPQKCTVFEDVSPPSAEYQARWIAQLRIRHPEIDIECGIWKDRVDRVGLLLEAGANSVSKFPILRSFGTPEAHEIESQTKDAGRRFKGTMTDLPMVDWEHKIEELPFNDSLKQEIAKRLAIYLNKMKKTMTQSS